jgi:hypothetical protein
LVNAARGLVKSYGQRLPKCGTQQVSRELAARLNAELRDVLEPLLKEIESLFRRGSLSRSVSPSGGRRSWAPGQVRAPSVWSNVSIS